MIFIIPLLVLVVIILVIVLRSDQSIKGGLDATYTPSEEQIEKFFQLYDKYIQKGIGQKKLMVDYCDIDEKIPYETKMSRLIHNTSMHLGQWKLFLSELQFLTYCVTKHTDSGYLVYAGSAPSQKIYKLHELFPNIKIVLIDPQEHWIKMPSESDEICDQYTKADICSSIMYFKVASGDRFKIHQKISASTGQPCMVNFMGEIMDRRLAAEKQRPPPEKIVQMIKESCGRIFIIESLFDDELATAMRGLDDHPVYFTSDIRTKAENDVSSVDILWNMAQQFIWAKLLCPAKYMFKFRQPFDRYDASMDTAIDNCATTWSAAKDHGIDFIADFKANTPHYLKYDKINLQAFPGVSSTEARLIGDSLAVCPVASLDEYEDKFNYYNKVIRRFAFYDVPMDSDIGIDGCADCALMWHIWREYAALRPDYNDTNILADIKDVLSAIRKTLYLERHGMRTTPFENLIAARKFYLSL